LHIELLDSLNSMLTFHSIYKIIAHIERRGETRMLKTKLFWRENIATPSWKKLKGDKIPQSRKVEHQWGPVQMSLHLREFTEFYVDGEIYGNCKGFPFNHKISFPLYSLISKCPPCLDSNGIALSQKLYTGAIQISNCYSE
jgi:hypothetical protein